MNTSSWNFSGAAKVANVTSSDNSEILLTPAVNNSSGAVFFSQPINFNKCKRWTVEFDCRLFDGTGADGMAFCFLDAPPTGFQNASNLGIPKSAKGIKICIDTWNNCATDPKQDMPKLEAVWGQGYGVYNNAGTLVSEGECRTDSIQITDNKSKFLSFLRSTNYSHIKITYESSATGGTIKVYTSIGVTLTANIPDFNFAAYVGFTASTGGSNDNQSIKNVVVYTDMPPSEAGTSPAPVCPGTSVQIGTANNSSYQYSWSPADGLSSTTISNPVATVTNTTGNILYKTYYVNTAFTTTPGCYSVDSVVIPVNPGPLADFDWAPVCLPNGTVNITNKTAINDGSDPNAADYTWTYPDNSIHKTKTPTYTVTTAGTYHFKLDVSSGAACKGHAEKDIVVNPKAKASITTVSPTTPGFCQDTAIQFNGSIGSLTAQTWHWDFADGSTDDTQNPLHKFTSNQTYTVNMYAVTTEGCHSDTAPKILVINPLPIANFTYTGLLCDGNTLHFTDASKPSVGTLQAYRWVFDNNTADPSNPVDKTFALGAHTVSLTVKNSEGCFSKPYTQTLTMGPVPVADFTVPLVCKGASGIYTDASTIADGTESKFTYAWNFGDGNPGTGKTPSHTYADAGPHEVNMTVSSGNGCTATAKKTVIISDNPVVDFSILTTNFCGNLPLQLKDNSSVQFGTLSSLNFYWDAAQPDFTQVNNPVAGDVYTHNYPTFGYTSSLQVTLKVRANATAGCYTEKTGTSILFASPKLVFGAIPTICQNSTQAITLNQARDTTIFPGSGYYTGDGVNNGLFTPAAAGPGPHIITYHYTLDGNKCSDTITQTAIVGVKPTVSAGPTMVILKGGQATLQGSATGGTNLVYAWTPINNLDDYTVLTPVASPPTDTYYTLKATNGDGCFDTSGTLVKVLQFPVVPNAFSPNNDGINDTWQISYISSYPDCKVQVFNRYGQMVFASTGYTKPWDGMYHGDIAPVGTYYYIITSAHLPVPLSGSVTLLR